MNKIGWVSCQVPQPKKRIFSETMSITPGGIIDMSNNNSEVIKDSQALDFNFNFKFKLQAASSRRPVEPISLSKD